jgi:DNA invertase Pin-like site-specific DNA recombinase
MPPTGRSESRSVLTDPRFHARGAAAKVQGVVRTRSETIGQNSLSIAGSVGAATHDLGVTTSQRRIAYARVSTAGQDLDTQNRALVGVGVLPGDIYAEHISGAKADRPELANALRALRPGDALVVTKLDRLARSLKDLLAIVERIEATGASLVVIDQAVDTSTPAGRLFLQVVGAVAEFERALISERTKQALVGRPRGRQGGRPRALTGKRLQRARDLVDARELTMAEIAAAVGVSISTLQRTTR